MSITVAVTGGRDYADTAAVHIALNAINRTVGIALLVHGGATGADALARDWAIDHLVLNRAYEADWTKYRRAGGPIRNRRMLREAQPTYLIAFPGGDGTADCVKAAREMGIKVIEVQPPDLSTIGVPG